MIQTDASLFQSTHTIDAFEFKSFSSVQRGIEGTSQAGCERNALANVYEFLL